MKDENEKVRCHYEVLGVERDADASVIKKAHRKLALKWHPDKNQGSEEATKQFRLIQDAYETLSDPIERKWYDDHRDSILQGWSANNGASGSSEHDGVLFDLSPYMHPSCFDSYENNDPNGFYSVFSSVFSRIRDMEQEYSSSDKQSPNYISLNDLESLFPTNFGSGDSDYAGDISKFYAAWESYTTRLNFAWADQYDVREAENRRIRRLMEEENKKSRRSAKKEWNDSVLSLVRFVKRRDPRVKKHNEMVLRMKEQKLIEEKKLKEQKKEEMKKAKEQWRLEAEKFRQEEEQRDLDAGKFRLADLSDSDDYDYGNSKKKKKKKKKKGGKKKKKSEDEVEEVQDDETMQTNEEYEIGENITSETGMNDENVANAESDQENKEDEFMSELLDELELNAAENPNLEEDFENGELEPEVEFYEEEFSSEEEEEEEPEIWKCEICNKTFKSEAQYKQHLNSKKHKQMVKKFKNKK